MERYFIKLPHLKSCAIGLYFHGGTSVEEKETRGMSHLLEHLVFRKLSTLKNYELYQRLNKMGVDLHGFTEHEMIGFDAYTSPENVCDVVKILLKIFDDFHWEDIEIEAEKRVVLRQIDEKSEYYFEKEDRKKYYRGTSYAEPIMGNKGITDFSSEWIHEYKKKIFCEENATLIVVGNYPDSCEKILDDKSKAYNGKRNVLEKINYCIPKNFQNRTMEDDLIVENGSSLCDVYIAFDVGNELNAEQVEVLTSILAKGDGSKLSLELKERLGIVGDIWGECEEFVSFSRLKIEYLVENERLLESLGVCASIIGNMKNVTREEIEEVEKFYTLAHVWEDNPRSYNYMIAKKAFVLNRKTYLAKDLKKAYESIGKSELQETAKSLFSPANMCISITYDKNKLKKSMIKRKIKEMRDRTSNDRNAI